MTARSGSKRNLHLGVAYYPEHWPENRWDEDIKLMAAAKLSVARLAEFAWSTMEPSEGVFQFDWLERIIQKLAIAGISTVLGTPTAAPPAWLVQKHPNILTVGADGRRVQFGNRCHYCVTSSEFHAAVERIVEGMAVRFGANPNVVGWQLDNEYNRVCYCERCQQKFQAYLKQRYQTLDVLNEHWTTSYWSQTYSGWEQIPIPIGSHNPGLMLEFKRFTTENYRYFQQLQLNHLRSHLPANVWVTHNFMGWFDGFDHYVLNEDLDIASWDWYIGTGHHNYLQTGVIHDLTRGFKRKKFWVMETQPGTVNWKSVNNSLDKGEARAMAWHAVGHGADAVLYWQWRSALNGQEQYHGSLLDQSGQPRPFFSEAQRLGGEFARLSSYLSDATVQAKVAMLYDYESRWSIQWQVHHDEFDYVAHFTHYYQPLAELNVAVDVLGVKTLTSAEELSNYTIVFAPCLLMLDDRLVSILLEYVSKGGYLVLTLRSGMKDRFNALLPLRQPGPLAEAAGIEVEEYYALDTSIPIEGKFISGQAHTWAERLHSLSPRATSVMARYGPANGWLDKQIAISVKSYGSGIIYYVGAYLDDNAQRMFIKQILKSSRVMTILSPVGIEIRVLTISNSMQMPYGKELYLVINHRNVDQEFIMPWPSYDHLSDHVISTNIRLRPYGVAILNPLVSPQP